MKRPLWMMALAVVMVMAMAGPALAGEVNGSKNGKDGSWAIPAPSHAASACVYSGLEDSELSGEVQGLHGVVQNWGHSKDAPFILDSRGASYVEIDGEAFGAPAGTVVVEGCNPHLGVADSD
jgi:hypothetical protein